jgi:hypothetical protein
MAFTRGNDAKETLGLGVFSPLVKEMKEYFDTSVLSGTSYWSNSPHVPIEYDRKSGIPPEYKNVTDSTGGNAHRFLVLLKAKVRDPLSGSKENIRSMQSSIKGKFQRLGCKISAFNYYIDGKMAKKHGMTVDEGTFSLLIEVIYSKNSKT